MGWVKVDRDITNHWLWSDKPFSRGQAWLDLVLNANHEEATVMVKGQTYRLKRGQQARSVLTLAKTWGWTRGKTERFLKLLKTEHQIEHQADNKTSIITICNYGKYQDKRAPDDTANRAPKQTATEQHPSTEEEERRKKKEKDSPSGDGRVSQMPVSAKFCEQVIEQFIELCPELPSPRLVDEKRINAIRRITKLKIPGKDLTTIEFWQSLFEYIHKSDFLCGRSSDFKAGIDWIVTPANFKKIIEGNYENRQQAS